LARNHYDDGGFSGGNLEHPALQRLLDDIQASRIDIVVVYKVDRLTRSLADFARLVELFDRAECVIRLGDAAIQYESCYPFRVTVMAGGLVSLDPDRLAMTRPAAAQIDKIIKGASPADIPVEQPARFELYINLKTARLLNLTIPPSLLARGDEVIE
jgi:hypothetical protein